MNVTLFAI